MKKLLSLFTAFVLVSSVFTGCKEQDEEITLELYYYKQENSQGLKQVVKRFEAHNPDISVNMLIIPNGSDIAISSMGEEGHLPDIIQMQSYSRVQEYAEKGWLVDLTKEECMESVLPGSFASVTYNKKQYALPTDFSGIGILYNKDIFKKLGLKVPSTWSELKKTCDVLKRNKIVPFAGLLKDNWSSGHFISMIHTSLLKEKENDVFQFISEMNKGKTSFGSINQEKLFEILDFYRDNMNKNASEMGSSEQQKSFVNGESAMMVQGLWSYIDAKNLNPKLNVGFIPFPVHENAGLNKFYADVDSCFAVSAQSSKAKQRAARKFLNWIASEEGVEYWVNEYKLIPPFTGVDYSNLDEPQATLMSSSVNKGFYQWAFAMYPQAVFEEACKNGAQKYLLKKTTGEELINNIDEVWKKSLEK